MNNKKAKDCTDAPIMIFKGRTWNILKVEQMRKSCNNVIFAYQFHIKDKRGNFEIRICDKNQKLRIPDY